MYINIYRELDQVNSTSQGLSALLAMAAQLTKKEQERIVSILSSYPVYYMC